MLNKRHTILGALTSIVALPGLSDVAATPATGALPMTARPEQLHAALTYCIDFAKQMLETSGEFYPFGASLNSSGELATRGGSNGEEHPKVAEIYNLLWGSFRDEARTGDIAGAALAINVNIPVEYQAKWPDGIRVHLESSDFSRYVYVPYRIVKTGFLKSKRQVELDEPFAVEVGHEFFMAEAG